jgi:hypothetical protein
MAADVQSQINISQEALYKLVDKKCEGSQVCNFSKMVQQSASMGDMITSLSKTNVSYKELEHADPKKFERTLAIARISIYAPWLANEWWARWFHPSYRFPTTTTLDQSMYTDQAAAFMSLGYLMGLELAPSPITTKR